MTSGRGSSACRDPNDRNIAKVSTLRDTPPIAGAGSPDRNQDRGRQQRLREGEPARNTGHEHETRQEANRISLCPSHPGRALARFDDISLACCASFEPVCGSGATGPRSRKETVQRSDATCSGVQVKRLSHDHVLRGTTASDCNDRCAARKALWQFLRCQACDPSGRCSETRRRNACGLQMGREAYAPASTPV